MTSNEYHLDETWKLLQIGVIVAELEAAEAEDAVRTEGYGDGRRKALEAAERALEEAEQALADREETISDSRWGSW